MEIITQAAIGLSQFLHPDYTSSSGGSPPDYVEVVEYPGAPYINLSEILVKVCSIIILVIMVILIGNYIINSVKRLRQR